MIVTRVQQVLLAVVILCIVGALAVGVYGRSRKFKPNTPIYTPPPAQTSAPMLVVHVAGAVMTPGVYRIPWGARVQDAVLAAGGFAPNADRQAVNLAALVEDGQRIEIPALQVRRAAPAADASGRRLEFPLNLNTATTEELEKLPGIGPELAARIVNYRRQYGPFRHVEDLVAVPGIGRKRLEQVRPYVTVR